MIDHLLTPQQAADYLGLKISALARWRMAGGGPKYVKINARARRYRKTDLEAWVEARLRTSTSDPGRSSATG